MSHGAVTVIAVLAYTRVWSMRKANHVMSERDVGRTIESIPSAGIGLGIVPGHDAEPAYCRCRTADCRIGVVVAGLRDI